MNTERGNPLFKRGIMRKFTAIFYLVLGYFAVVFEYGSIILRSLFESRFFFCKGVFIEDFQFRIKDPRVLTFKDIHEVFNEYWNE